MKLYRTFNNIKLKSYKGFQWQGVGLKTVALDWNPDPAIDCGEGLHGVKWGEGGNCWIGEMMYWLQRLKLIIL